jgi:hypothetical protein
MVRMSIKLVPAEGKDTCGLCGKETSGDSGPRLYLVDREVGVCQGCGQQHAPSLVALLTLAKVAKRVGTIGRHTVVPPMEALLDLARAAENFSFSMSGNARQAA